MHWEKWTTISSASQKFYHSLSPQHTRFKKKYFLFPFILHSYDLFLFAIFPFKFVWFFPGCCQSLLACSFLWCEQKWLKHQMMTRLEIKKLLHDCCANLREHSFAVFSSSRAVSRPHFALPAHTSTAPGSRPTACMHSGDSAKCDANCTASSCLLFC